MREKIIAGNIYHVLSRGVDKRDIFLDDNDRFRFIHDLFEFNDTSPVNNAFYRFQYMSNNVAHPYSNIDSGRKSRKLLVEILAFCLMSNHYHLFIRPLFDDGLFKFMKKLNTGYVKYFNEKHKRRGALFESRYKSIIVSDEAHFIHLPYYIHFNPLDLIMPEWRQKEIKDKERAIRFLENYRWSSHLDYIGRKNFPSITSRDFLLEFFGGSEKYKQDIENWINNLDFNDIQSLTLEN